MTTTTRTRWTQKKNIKKGLLNTVRDGFHLCDMRTAYRGVGQVQLSHLAGQLWQQGRGGVNGGQGTPRPMGVCAATGNHLWKSHGGIVIHTIIINITKTEKKKISKKMWFVFFFLLFFAFPFYFPICSCSTQWIKLWGNRIDLRDQQDTKLRRFIPIYSVLFSRQLNPTFPTELLVWMVVFAISRPVMWVKCSCKTTWGHSASHQLDKTTN